MSRSTVLGIFTVFAFIFILLATPTPYTQVQAQEGDSPLSTAPYPGPIATPTPEPTPEPKPEPSEYAKAALAYIVQRERLPLDEYVIIAEDAPYYSWILQKQFQYVVITDQKPNGPTFYLKVDVSNGEILDSLEVVQAEQATKKERYGKFDPQLFDYLQGLSDADMIEVELRLGGPEMNLAPRIARATEILSAKYPAVREAVERHGGPLMLEDEALGTKVYQEYIKLIRPDYKVIAASVIAHLEKSEIEFEYIDDSPIISINISKLDLMEIIKHQNIGRVYLRDSITYQPLLVNSSLTNRSVAVQSRGYNGSGSRISIIDIGNIDTTSSGSSQCPAGNNCFSNFAGPTRLSSPSYADHPTLVASSALSNHLTHKGSAPGAILIDGGLPLVPVASDIRAALEWSFGLRDATIANMSIGKCTGGYYEPGAEYVDEMTTSYSRLIVIAAGNGSAGSGCPTGHVTSPGLAVNAFTVGSYAHITQPSNPVSAEWWGDDQLLPDNIHSTLNPLAGYEKPEIVAPGGNNTTTGNLTMIGQNGILIPGWGTSFAAPQVAGAAAVLVHRNSLLKNAPEALKAILMATATNNIPGTALGMPVGTDHKDGAGGMNIDLAYQVATTKGDSAATICDKPCWWYEPNLLETDFVGNYRDYKFYARKGDEIRVTISWLNPWQCGDGCSAAPIDLQLQLLRPSGGQIASSYIEPNNFELIPLTNRLILPDEGTYTIRVIKRDGYFFGNFTRLGVAWTKVYHSCNLPDIPVPADYNNDGKADKARWCPGDGVLYIEYSDSTNPPVSIPWGAGRSPYNDKPVAGDFDGDGWTDFAVWRPSEGKWYVKNIRTGATSSFVWGQVGDIPLTGDVDNDGKDDYIIYRPKPSSEWYVKYATGGIAPTVYWGTNAGGGDIPFSKDFDGDGRSDYGVFRPSNTTWYIKPASGGSITPVVWGASNGLVVPADYNGDGKADYATWTSTYGIWDIKFTSSGTASMLLGGPGDVPVPAGYSNTGQARTAVWRWNEGRWIIGISP
jgi:Subtilase family/FG-GAP-like repeat